MPVSALLISIMLLLTAIATSGFSATHPGTDSVTYQLNANTGQATWQSSDQHLDDWTRQFFPTRTGQGPFQERAPTVALAAPTVTLQSDTMSGDVRMLRVQVISARHAEDAFVQVEAQGEIVAATLDGKPFELSVLPESARYQLELHVNEQGQLTRLSTQRYRGEHGELTPWSVQLNEYQEVDGMQIPTKSEVTWHLASGEFTWLRFQITEIEYNQSGKVTQF